MTNYIHLPSLMMSYFWSSGVHHWAGTLWVPRS